MSISERTKKAQGRFIWQPDQIEIEIPMQESVLDEVYRILREANPYHSSKTGQFTNGPAKVGNVSELLGQGGHHAHKVTSLPHGGVKVSHTGPAHEGAASTAAAHAHLVAHGAVAKIHPEGHITVSHFKIPKGAAPASTHTAATATAHKLAPATKENTASLLKAQGHTQATSYEHFAQSGGFHVKEHTTGIGTFVHHKSSITTEQMHSNLTKAGAHVSAVPGGLHVTHVPDTSAPHVNPAPPPQPHAAPTKSTKAKAGTTDPAVAKASAIRPASGNPANAHMRAHQVLGDDHATAIEYKVGVQNGLSARLENHPTFKAWALKEQGGVEAGLNPSKAVPDMVRQLVGRWAMTSGDTHPGAIAMQRAIQEEFGLKSTMGHLTRKMKGYKGSELAATYAKDGPAMRVFARAMYDHTQAHLQAHGITEMTLYRGVKGKGTGLTHTGSLTTGHVATQPASSWSYDFNTARGFATGGGTGSTKSGLHAVMAAHIPRERILGSTKTGFGAKSEYEVVVLGGTDHVGMYGWSSKSFSHAPLGAENMMQKP